MNLDKSIKVMTRSAGIKIYKDMTKAGRVIEAYIHPGAGSHIGNRYPKSKITADNVRKNNERISDRHLRLLIEANFYEHSGLYTLTHRDGVDAPTAKKRLNNFIRRLKRRLPNVKMIFVTEYENKRPHHHVLIDSLDVKLITEVWGYGRVHLTATEKVGEYKRLGNYLTKETTKTFRKSGALSAERYSHTRNLIMPITKRTETTIQELEADPEPIPGYYIDKDSIRRYDHPVTGLPCLEYTMIAIGAPRKYKVWPKGRTAPKRERFKIQEWNEQQSMLDDLCDDARGER